MFWFLLSTLFLVAGCEEYEEIITDLNQKDANIILVFLKQNNISAKKVLHASKKAQVFSIETNKKEADNALKIIVDNHLPKQESLGLNKVYSIDSSNLISTKSDEQAKLLMATQAEIENLLKVIPSVIEAKVVLSINEPVKTASVVVLTKNDLAESEIKGIVSASVALLDKDNINVVIKRHEFKDYFYAVDESNTLAKPEQELFSIRKTKWAYGLIAITFISLCLCGFLLRKTITQSMVLLFNRANQ